MNQKTPEQVRAGILERISKAENGLDTAKVVQRATKSPRSSLKVTKATEELERLKRMLADHDAQNGQGA